MYYSCKIRLGLLLGFLDGLGIAGLMKNYHKLDPTAITHKDNVYAEAWAFTLHLRNTVDFTKMRRLKHL